jgi:hypothetical protein
MFKGKKKEIERRNQTQKLRRKIKYVHFFRCTTKKDNNVFFLEKRGPPIENFVKSMGVN